MAANYCFPDKTWFMWRHYKLTLQLSSYSDFIKHHAMIVYLFIPLILLFISFLNLSKKKAANHRLPDEILNEIFSGIPDEILTEIFSRLPAKSVGKLRCVSKTWRSCLSTSHFINLHLSHKTHQESLILLTPHNSLHIIKPPIENPTISRKLELQNTWTRVVGSCNGLVLLLDSEKQMFLVNPTTLEQFQVPNLTFESKKLPRPMLRGFGYDSFSDDYKILVLSYYDSADNEDLRSFDTSVDLYSVKFGVWRRINHSFTYFAVCGSSCGAFTNGYINWFVNGISPRSPFAILAFNLATEVFYEIEIPWNIDGPYSCCRVFAHQGCLFTINPLSSGKIDLWMMKEYGKVNSWTRLGTVDGNGKWHMREPLCFSRDKEIVLLTYEGIMLAYNLQEGTVKNMVVNGVPASFRDGFTFVDSIVSARVITSSS